MSFWVAGATVVGAGISAAGSYASASGTQSAQNAANKAAAQQAAAQSAQQFYNYLASRGIDILQVARSNPAYETEYNRVKGLGEKRDFQTWLYDHLKATPGDSLWDAIANPAGAGAAANTTLPAWAVDANGKPLQPSLLNDLVKVKTFGGDQALAGAFQNAAADPKAFWLSNHPNAQAEWNANANGVRDYYGGDFDAMVRDNIANLGTAAEKAALAGTLTPEQFIAGRAATTGTPTAGGGTVAQPGAPGGVVDTTKLDPGLAKVIFGSGAAAPGAGGPAIGPTVAGAPTSGSALPTATFASGVSTAGTAPGTPANAAANIFNGVYLQDILNGLEPVAAARNAAAAAQRARVEEQRTLSGGLRDTELAGIQSVLDARKTGAGTIYDAAVTGAGGIRDASTEAARAVNEANITKLADLLGVRREAAEQIYQAANASATGVRDARTTGAQGIYGADLLRADTIGQSAKQALDRVLAGQAAVRLRQGFTGGSSGTDITRARLMSDAIQRGAGERADAGVRLQGRLSDAGVGFAQDAGAAGVGRATTLGMAGEQDAIGKLNSAVDLARSLGLAGTNYATSVAGAGNTRATTLAGAGEQDAIAQLQSRVADATRRLSYLTSDADIAKAQADLQNAQDGLNAIVSNQNRMTSSLTVPYNLAAADLALKGSLNSQQYSEIDQLLARLGSFTGAPAGGPGLTTSPTGSVLNGGQIAGGALSTLGSSLSSYASSKDIQDLIKALSSSTAGGGTTTSTSTATSPSILSSPNFLAGASVFRGPNPGG